MLIIQTQGPIAHNEKCKAKMNSAKLKKKIKKKTIKYKIEVLLMKCFDVFWSFAQSITFFGLLRYSFIGNCWSFAQFIDKSDNVIRRKFPTDSAG